ncbi:MAG: hypothetical protein VX589_18455 [Myxococcota bacterium]|nr:hypothetical protein [Myxococcota bacterium]
MKKSTMGNGCSAVIGYQVMCRCGLNDQAQTITAQAPGKSIASMSLTIGLMAELLTIPPKDPNEVWCPGCARARLAHPPAMRAGARPCEAQAFDDTPDWRRVGGAWKAPRANRVDALVP